VYRAKFLEDDSFRAVKTIEKKILNTEARLAMMTREISILRRVEHEFIIKLDRIYEDANAVHIVTGLVEGVTLYQ
jgi:serine/threonine protein kinase